MLPYPSLGLVPIEQRTMEPYRHESSVTVGPSLVDGLKSDPTDGSTVVIRVTKESDG